MIEKVFISTLGCSKNLVDSEVMLSILHEKGITKVEAPELADLAIVNTCGFIESAKEESIGEILEIAKHKEQGDLKYLVVTGCLSQRYQQDLEKELPEVDAFLGTTSFEHIYDIVSGLEKGYGQNLILDVNQPVGMNQGRELLTQSYTAFVKIAEGCDNLCTYCIIPKLRGKYRSRELEDIVLEVQGLADKGVKEIILIAQDTSKYGTDLYGEKSLGKLLRRLNEIESLQWIRFLYTYPEDIDQELIEAVRDSEKVCRYFDMPVQHGSDAVLRRMNRGTSQRDIEEKVSMIREYLPDAVIRTTIITGFPGETQEDFAILEDMVRNIKFDRLGVFAYSMEEDTPAAKLPDQIPQELKESRRNRIMEIQQGISLEKNRELVGQTLEILLEEEVEPNLYEGRSKRDVPEIDNSVFVHTNGKHQAGDFVMAVIRDAMEYDLMGDELDEPGK